MNAIQKARQELSEPIEIPPMGFTLGDCSTPGMFEYMVNFTDAVRAGVAYRYHLKMAARYRRLARAIGRPQPPTAGDKHGQT